MGDPLSFATGVISLVSAGLQTIEYLTKYYTEYRDRDDSLARTTKRLENLLSSLRLIDDVIQVRKWHANEQGILRHVEASILGCEEVIGELEEQMNKFKKVPRNSIMNTIKAIGRNAAYPIRASTLTKIKEDVDAFQSNLLTALESLNLKSYQNTQDGVNEIKTTLKNVHARTIAADMRRWLNAPDATIDYNSACSKRHAATGSWFVKSDQFKTWLQTENSFLWLYGFAGCGKSVLSSTAIQHTFRHQRNQREGAVAYFFFTFNDKTKQDTGAMLRALLLQLCGQVNGFEGDLFKLKESHEHGTPSNLVLQEYLRQAICRAGHVFVILDALDECPDDDQKREVLLSSIEVMRAWGLAGLHLLVTSRDHPDIRQALNPTMMTQLALRGDEVSQDIEEFVTYQVEHDVNLRRWVNHCEMIKQHLVQHAGGVFRWVECQLGTLRRCLRSEKHLKKCLQSLPRTLDATYEQMLCNINEDCRGEALRLLTLLCFSACPLSVAEILDALAVDLEANCYDYTSRLASSDDLLQICTGLIDLDEHGGGDSNDHDDTDRLDHHNEISTDHMSDSSRQTYVRIAHFSVREYLFCHRIVDSSAQAFSLNASIGHAQLSKMSLIYLCNPDFVNQPLTKTLLHQYPFAQFAASFWFYHYCKSDRILDSQLDTWSYTLLTKKSFLDRYVRLHNPDNPNPQGRKGVFIRATFRQAEGPSYYAALLGLENVLGRILSDGHTDVNAEEGVYGSALQAASAGGHMDVVRLLLEQEADVNAQGGYYGNALRAASSGNHTDVVRLLLRQGADVNAQGRGHGDALQAASERGHMDMVRLLLEQGADVNAQGGFYNSALQAASDGGHMDVVRFLLKQGADLNAEGGGYG